MVKSLVLSGIGVKRMLSWPFNILQKLRAWKKSGSQVMAKSGSQPKRFQYSLIAITLFVDSYLALIFGM